MTITNKKRVVFGASAWLLACAAGAHEPLSDEQLDAITAGADDTQLAEVVVNASRVTARGTQISADGKLAVQRSPGSIHTADLLLRDSAQSNLQSLVNLNAVHSVVNVLVNLNVNIDSHVGEVHQMNFATPPGR
jgi:hypothetical protein